MSGCIFPTKACVNNRKQNLLNSNISSTCPHNMVNFGPLTAEIGSGVCGIPANFNGFRVLPSLLQRRRSPQANQILYGVWSFPALVHYRYIYIFWGSCPLTEFCHNSLYVQVVRSPILAALLNITRAAGVSQTLRHGTRYTEGATYFRLAAITLGIGPHSSSIFVPFAGLTAHIVRSSTRKFVKFGFPQKF